MTRVDFYVLSDASPAVRLELVCKLAEKACGQSKKVFIYSQEPQLLQELDEQLWDFRAMSFIAHRLLPDAHVISSDDDDPVLLSTALPGNDRNLLVNLDAQVPAFFSRFERTLEVVNKDPAIQENGRYRYRFYQQRGYPLHHHNV